jgi:hypothetical protein
MLKDLNIAKDSSKLVNASTPLGEHVFFQFMIFRLYLFMRIYAKMVLLTKILELFTNIYKIKNEVKNELCVMMKIYLIF